MNGVLDLEIRAVLGALCGVGVGLLAYTLGVPGDYSTAVGAVTALGVLLVLSANPHD